MPGIRREADGDDLRPGATSHQARGEEEANRERGISWDVHTRISIHPRVTRAGSAWRVGHGGWVCRAGVETGNEGNVAAGAATGRRREGFWHGRARVHCA